MSTGQTNPKPGDRVRVTFEATWTHMNGGLRCVVAGADQSAGSGWPAMIPDAAIVEVLGEEQPPAPASSVEGGLSEVMPAVIKLLTEQASACATEADLAAALGNAAWLNVIATRILGSAVLSYANGGTIPGPPRGSHGKRAALVLDAELLTDPDLSDVLDQALRLQRSAHFACKTAKGYLTKDTA